MAGWLDGWISQRGGGFPVSAFTLSLFLLRLCRQINDIHRPPERRMSSAPWWLHSNGIQFSAVTQPLVQGTTPTHPRTHGSHRKHISEYNPSSQSNWKTLADSFISDARRCVRANLHVEGVLETLSDLHEQK